MTDFPTGMPVIARGKWFRGMTLIPGYGAVGCNPQEHPAADVPIRPDLAHRPGLPGRRRESSRAPDRAIPGGSTADPPDVQRAGRSWRHGAARRWTDATAATVRNGSRSAGRQPRPVTFVPRAETSKGRLPPLTWEPVSGFEPLTCRLQEVRPRTPYALAAQMTPIIALTAPAALGLSARRSTNRSTLGGRQYPNDRNKA